MLVVAFAAAAIAAGTVSARTDGPPHGLSNRGRALWNFEALLHDKFGNRLVCTRNGSLNFVAGSCSPLATWSPYFYVFATARHSAFHTIARKPRGSFGNYPVLVRVVGEFVACGPRSRTFLIEYSDAAAFTVDCIAPTP